MKKRLQGALVISALLLATRSGAEETTVFKTDRDKANYVIGVNLVRDCGKQGIDLDLDMVIRGMKDAASGEKLLMDEYELRATTNAIRQGLRDRLLKK